LTIADAIKRAPTEPVVYFLLTSYLDARMHADGARDQWTVQEALEVVHAATERLAQFKRPAPADMATRRRAYAPPRFARRCGALP
jgi:hypothetical protein